MKRLDDAESEDEQEQVVEHKRDAIANELFDAASGDVSKIFFLETSSEFFWQKIFTLRRKMLRWYVEYLKY